MNLLNKFERSYLFMGIAFLLEGVIQIALIWFWIVISLIDNHIQWHLLGLFLGYPICMIWVHNRVLERFPVHHVEMFKDTHGVSKWGTFAFTCGVLILFRVAVIILVRTFVNSKFRQEDCEGKHIFIHPLRF